MNGLRVETCGPGSSLQDGGRPGWRRHGVPGSGAMDRLRLAHANALVGNPPAAAALELVLAGATFTVLGGPLRLAVSGGVRLRVAGQPVRTGSSVLAAAGETVAVGDVHAGVYAYLAVGGGLAGRKELGSRSQHRRSGIGGPPLRAGDRLAVRDATAFRSAPGDIPSPAMATGPIRILPGPQADRFSDGVREELLAASWRVSPQSDRMGCRLAGPRLAHLAGHDIVSDGVLPGAVQVPGDGQPIILGRDGPTTGGYPKIAVVISADIDRLAQVVPGGEIRFAATSLAAAVAAARALARRIEGLAAGSGGLRSGDLLAANLIDGVVDATGDGAGDSGPL